MLKKYHFKLEKVIKSNEIKVYQILSKHPQLKKLSDQLIKYYHFSIELSKKIKVNYLNSWKKVSIRKSLLTANLILALLLNLVSPAISQSTVFADPVPLPNEDIFTDEYTNALFVSKNPAFTAKFGDKAEKGKPLVEFELRNSDKPTGLKMEFVESGVIGDKEEDEERAVPEVPQEPPLIEEVAETIEAKEAPENNPEAEDSGDLAQIPETNEEDPQLDLEEYKTLSNEERLEALKAEATSLETESAQVYQEMDKEITSLENLRDTVKANQSQFKLKTKQQAVLDMGAESTNILSVSALKKTDLAKPQEPALLKKLDLVSKLGFSNLPPSAEETFEKDMEKTVVVSEEATHGVDLVYEILEDRGVKESIVIKTPPSQVQEGQAIPDIYPEPNGSGARYLPAQAGDIQNTYLFELQLEEGVTPQRKFNGEWRFVDENGGYLYHFAKPYMVDSNGVRSNDVEINILPHTNNQNLITNTYSVRVTADLAWLTSPDRTFPISIDPTILHDAQGELTTGEENRVSVSATPATTLNYPTLPADEGVVGLWHMDDNVSGASQTISDDSGNSNHGLTYDAGADYMDCTVAGNIDSYGCYFDGSDDYIKVADSASLDITQGTIETWINSSASGGGSSEGPNSVTEASDSGTDWADITNVYSDNESYATRTGGGASSQIQATNCNFNIPSEATIVGVEVKIDRKSNYNDSASYVRDYEVYIIKNGALGGTNKANTVDNWPTEDTIATYGGEDDLWNDTWLPEDINASNFGVALSVLPGGKVGPADAYVDHIKITVYYSPPDSCIVGKGQDAYQIDIDSSNAITGYINTDNTVTGTLPNSNSWHHVTMTYDGSIQRLYINGKQTSETAYSGSISTNATALLIGDSLNGYLDEVAIHNRVLTPEEIASHASKLPWGTLTSNTLDLGDKLDTLQSLQWSESGVATGDGETVYDDENLIAEWDFNETSGTTADNGAGIDSCGGTPANCDGTLYSFSDTAGQDSTAGSGWTSDNGLWPASTPGALMIDGSDDYVKVGDNSNLDFASADDFSIETWVKHNGAIATNPDYILTKADGTNGGYKVYMDASGDLCFAVDDDSSWDPDDSACTSGVDYDDNIWHHIVAVKDGTTSLTLYVDGENVASDATISATNTLANAGDLFIGVDTDSTSNEWDGVIDITRLYSRALSANEVLSLTNTTDIEFQTRTGSYDGSGDYSWSSWRPSSDDANITQIDSLDDQYLFSTSDEYLVGYWPMDETSGTTVDDVSSENHTGTAVNGATVVNGKHSHARNFDGSDDYIEIGTGPTSVKTAQFWVYPQTTTEYFLNFTGATDYIWANSGTVTATGFTSPTIYVNGQASTTIMSNQWQHIAVTTATAENASALKIGLVASSNYGEALIDEVRLFSEELSASTIQSHYSQGVEPATLNSVLQYSEGNIYAEGAKSQKITFGSPTINDTTVGLWHLDGTTDTLADASVNGNDGTAISSPAITAGFFGKAREFDGSADYIEIGAGPSSVNSASFWVNPDTTTEYFLNFTGATDYIWANSGTVTATGFTSPTIYVNGTASSTIVANEWQHITVTSDTAENASALKIGLVANTHFMDGQLDEILLTSDALSAQEVAKLYRSGQDHHFTQYFSSAIDLSSSTQIPVWLASDRPGTFLEAIFGETTYSLGLPDSTTVGLWKLDEPSQGTGQTFNDSSGYSNNGTSISNPTLEPGNLGQARHFDDTDDYITVADHSSLDLDGGSLTIMAWVKTDADEADNVILAKGSSYEVGINADGDLYWDGASATDDESALVKSGVWHHIAVTNNDTTATYYVDGQLTGTDSSGIDSDNNTELTIGYDGTNFFDGLIDEVRIDTTVRSADEIRQIYEVGKRAHLVTIDFVASLHADNLIADSDDTSFEVDATTYGAINQGDGLYDGDTVIVREFEGGQEYIAQAVAYAVTQSSGAVTIDEWDDQSTFPTGGFSANATVMKWQQEYINIPYSLRDEDINATRYLTWRITDASQGATVWLDDISHGSFMSGSANCGTSCYSDISSDNDQFLQYKAILTSQASIQENRGKILNTGVTPTLSEVRLVYSDTVNLDDLTSATYDLAGNKHLGSNNVNDVYFYDRTKDQFSYMLDFDGSDDYVDIGTGPTNVKTVEFWVYPETTTEYFVNFTGSTDYIWTNSGTVTATGFTSPTIYVNGETTTTIEADKWQHITVTSDTAENASALHIGRTAAGNYLEGKLDEVALFSDARTAEEIKKDYGARRLDETDTTTYDNLVALYHFDEGNSTSTMDSAGTYHGTLINMADTDWLWSADEKDQSPLPQQKLGIDPNWGNGIVRQSYSLDFDGTDDYVKVGDDNSLDITQGTVEMWAKGVVGSPGASSEGPNSPSTVSTDSGSGGTVDWSDPSYVTAEDGSSASATLARNMFCLAPDTLISTSHGPIPISQLKKSDLIFGYNFITKQPELIKVYQITHAPIVEADNRYYHIHTINNDLRATAPHLIYTSNRGFVRADELNEGDTLLDINQQPTRIEQINVEDNYTDDVWNLSTGGEHNFFANNLLVHNAGVYDHRVRIIKGGSIGSTDKASAEAWPGTLAYSTYGGDSELWGETWSYSDINSSDFGIAISAYATGYDINRTSYYLLATNFGFSIPESSTITGIKAEIKKNAAPFGSAAAVAYIDHIKITVYYSSGGASTLVGKGQSAYQIDIDDSNGLTGYISDNTVTGTLPDSTNWHHVAMTHDGSTQKLYINGQLEGSSDYTGSIGTNSNPLLINDGISGLIDEIAIFSDVRTASEISTDFRTRRIDDSDANLEALYHFDEGADDTCSGGTNDVCDASTNNLDGAKYNMDSADWVTGVNALMDNNSQYISLDGTTGNDNDKSFEVYLDTETTFKYRWSGDSSWTTPATATISSYTYANPTQVDSTGIYLGFDTTNGTFSEEDHYEVLSWAVEQANNTDSTEAMRGTLREFPQKAYLVAEDNYLDILDAESNNLWMRFPQGTNYMLGDSSSNDIATVTAGHGSVYIGTTGTGTGLYDINFADDTTYRYNATNRTTSDQDLADRTATNTYGSADTDYAIIDPTVFDVSTGIVQGKRYIFAATEDGGSMIVDDGDAVYDFLIDAAGGYDDDDLLDMVFLPTGGGDLYVNRCDTTTPCTIDAYNDITASTTNDEASFAEDRDASYDNTSTTPATLSNQIFDLEATAGTSILDNTSNTLLLGTDAGAVIIEENQADATNSSVKLHTKDLITELMIGDIQGMWSLTEDPAGGGTFADSSGNSNTLTLVDADGDSATASGVRGKGYAFEGDGDYAWIADNASLSTGDVDFTVGAWVKLDGISAVQNLVSKWDADPNNEFNLTFENTNQTMRWDVSNDGTARQWLRSSTFGTVSSGTWYFVLGWHDSINNQIGICVNNVCDSQAHTTGVADTASIFTVGQAVSNPTEDLEGTIDEVFFTKEVLTSTQRTRLYKDGLASLNNAHSIADTYNELFENTSGGVSRVTAIYPALIYRSGLPRLHSLFVGTNSTSADDGAFSALDGTTNILKYFANESSTAPGTVVELVDNDISSISSSNDGVYCIVGTDDSGITLLYNQVDGVSSTTMRHGKTFGSGRERPLR